MSANNITRIVVVAGPKRGKSTLGKKLSEQHRLTHLCTDPQRMLTRSENGTPDDLDYSGENGTGAWVESNWLGRERTLIEGVKAIDALRRYLQADPSRRTSHICDMVIVLTERVDSDEPLPGQERQATHVMNVLEELEDQFDNLQLWFPTGGGFLRADY